MQAPGALTAIQFPPATARKWVLPNGLVVIVQEDHSAPVASIQAWCQTGSIDEGRHLGAGLSHILEHMLFKGTATRKNSEIAQKVQDAGGYINAFTSFDRTVYWIDMPSKGVAEALDILADAMMNSTLPPEEFAKEQDVIRREFAMGHDDPDRVLSYTLFDTAYAVSPVRSPVIGYLDVFNGLTRDDVMAYYKARYVPNNLFFVIAGDVDAEKVRAQLESYFAAYPRISLPPLYIPEEPRQLGRRESHTEFPTSLTRLSLSWHIPGITDADIPALELLSNILGTGRSSILYRKLREEKGLVASVSAFTYAAAKTGLFGLDATLEHAHREETTRLMLGIMQDLKQHGVDPAALEKAKKQALSHQLQSLTTMRGIAFDLGSNWLQTRSLNFSHDYLNALQKVTVEDVSRVLREYFDDSNLTIVSLNPTGALNSGNATTTATAAGEIQKFVLPNGLRLLVREDPRLPLVSMTACFKAGLLAETPGNNGISSLLSKVIIKGTATRTAAQIADAVEAVGGGIGGDSGYNSVRVSVGVTRPDLALGLDILSDVLAHATMPEEAIQRERESLIAEIMDDDDHPTSVASNIMRGKLYPGHPYGMRVTGTAATLQGIGRRELIEYRDKYITAANGVLAVFGDVKAAEVRELVEKQFAALPTGEPQLAELPIPAPLDGDSTTVSAMQKSQAILMFGFPGVDIYSEDRDALELIHIASSDLGSRFFIRIREKMGAAYFVGASQAPGLVPGPFIFYVGTAPEKIEAVKHELRDEIHLLAVHGLTPEELARAKEKMIGQQDIRNQRNDAFGASAALDELYGLGFDDYKKTRQSVEAITLEDVKRVANKYFENKPSALVIVSPTPQGE